MAQNSQQQLSGHPQFNTLTTPQIHYIQFPATTVFHDNRPNQHNFLRTSAGVTTIGGTCLICLQLLPTKSRTRGVTKPVEVFSKICELLQVPVSEIQHEWSLLLREKLPFCTPCSDRLQELISLQEQLADIEGRLIEGIDIVRRTIQETDNRVPANDSKTINFRTKVLRYDNQFISSRRKPTQDVVVNEIPRNVPDFTFTTPISSLIIQQDPSTHLQQHETDPTSSSRLYPSLETSQPSSSQNDSFFPSSTATYSGYCQDNSNNSSVDNDGYDSIAGIKSDSDDEHNNENPGQKQHFNFVKETRKPTKTRRDTKSRNANNKRQTGGNRQTNEYFAPVHTDAQGIMTFEGIIITPGESGYLCGQCGASCGKGNSSAALRKVKIHIKGFHLGAYKCGICNKNFTSNDILSQHKTRTHSQEAEESVCDICQKPIRPRHMDAHKYTHMNSHEKALFVASGFKPLPSDKDLVKRFECKICSQKFKKAKYLRRHERSHLDIHQRKEHKCLLCERAYTTDRALREHLWREHEQVEVNNVRRRMCPHCRKIILAQAYKKHLLTHVAKEDRPFVCKICGARFGSAQSVQAHEARHDPSEKPTSFKFECDICGKMFKTLSNMRNHRRKVHKNHFKTAVPVTLIKDITIDKPGKDGYLDDLNNEGLQQVEGGLFSYHLYEVKLLESPTKGYRCCTCLQEFVGEGDEVEEQVKLHIKSEHIGNVRCNICTKRMKNVSQVLAHQKVEHGDKFRLECEICQKPGIAVKNYKGHIWQHKNPYEVADAINAGVICSNNYVNEHQSILSELGVQLAFKCILCDDQFDKVENLYRHRLAQHPDAPKTKMKRRQVENPRGRKRVYPKGPCECPKCGVPFTRGKNLSRHLIKVHNIRVREQLKKTEKSVPEKRSKRVKIKQKHLSSASESGESDLEEEDNDSNNESDPEFKAIMPQIETSHVNLRDRSTLRRSARNFPRNDSEMRNVRVIVERLPTPVNSESIKMDNKFTIEYITPEGEFSELPLIPENDIKQSPQSSDAEWDSD